MQPSTGPRVIVENCHRVDIRRLYLDELIRPGEHTEGRLPGSGLPFRAWLRDDLLVGCIEIPPWPLWEIRQRPTKASAWFDDAHWYVLGHKDGRRYRELLVTSDLAQVGTRRDLSAHYASSHGGRSTTKRWKKRATILHKLEVYGQDPRDMNRAYVPFDYHNGSEQTKPKGIWWRTWWEKIRGYHRHEASSDIILVPVRRPVGISTPEFNRLLNTLNKSAIKAGQVKAFSYVKARRRRKWPRAGALIEV